MATKEIPLAFQEPGRPVGVIATNTRKTPNGGEHVETIFWAVSEHRKDFNLIVHRQKVRKQLGDALPKYSDHLVKAMFKNWGNT